MVIISAQKGNGKAYKGGKGGKKGSKDGKSCYECGQAGFVGPILVFVSCLILML